MSVPGNGPGAGKSAVNRDSAAFSLAVQLLGFDAQAARRLEFVRWLVATGRLSERDRPGHAGAAGAGPTTPPPPSAARRGFH